MIGRLFTEMKRFSKENWWIYILLFFTIAVVAVTGKGNIVEILSLFSINLLGALFNMLMMNAYKNKKFAEGSVFILIATCLYTTLSLYAWLHDGDMQYIYWQTSFLLTSIKAFMLYTYKIDLKYINFYTILTLNICVFYILVSHVGIGTFAMIQSLGICFVTLGLSLKNDEYRYFLILFGNALLVVGGILIIRENYLSGNILGVTIAYTLLGLSTLVYYLKLLPDYISRYKRL